MQRSHFIQGDWWIWSTSCALPLELANFKKLANTSSAAWWLSRTKGRGQWRSPRIPVKHDIFSGCRQDKPPLVFGCNNGMVAVQHLPQACSNRRVSGEQQSLGSRNWREGNHGPFWGHRYLIITTDHQNRLFHWLPYCMHYIVGMWVSFHVRNIDGSLDCFEERSDLANQYFMGSPHRSHGDVRNLCFHINTRLMLECILVSLAIYTG